MRVAARMMAWGLARSAVLCKLINALKGSLSMSTVGLTASGSAQHLQDGVSTLMSRP